ncbi:MAG: helix-turn-helix transcriptional regulator [Lachnospiraceae bacterium]|nr:helix-turn-helix transcriptional regulator [Lachnospiraceae bacterium]
MRFEEKIVELRKSKGLSQEELAEQLGVSRQAVSRWELGQTLPDITNLVQLCELFGVSADYLVRDEEQTSAKSDQSAKTIAKLTRERERIRYQARRFYYIAWADFIMALAFMLAFFMDSSWICFGVGIGQLVGAVIIWIFYNSAVNKIEKLNEDMENFE